MSPRQKSRLERLLSVNWHRKRWGAAKYRAPQADLATMKVRTLSEDLAEQTRGAVKSLDDHLANLRREFSGQPELIWYHAKLIVLIRREIQTSTTYARFRALWDAESSFFCERLNIRWLVSAADTFAEHDQDPEVRATAMLTSLFANTIKLHETERYLSDASALDPNLERVAHVQRELVPLFEGMSCFTVGTDDTLRNMRWRLQPFFSVKPTGPIFRAVWNRCQACNTVFARMRALHGRRRTRWWDND